MGHESRPPQVAELLGLLETHDVRFVISGSVAALLHGVALEPGDLDVVPSTDAGNLERLVGVLDLLEARPLGPFGEWTTRPDGEQKWIARTTTEEDILAWTPDVQDISSLDHLYGTCLGNLDVVPNVTGTYELLMRHAVQIAAGGCKPWVAHVDDLLARLTVPRRDKDVSRVADLRQIQQAKGDS